QGFISNFDLIENKSAKILFPKHRQILSDEDSETHQGFFTRRQECNDIYQGIEIIASTYGFPGIEPNTILMGWAKQSKEPTRFVNMIKYLIDLDLNILMLNYDKERGFGDCKLIDIWWRGGGNNGNLALSLIKFILLSNDWCNATIRLIIVNPVIDERKFLYRNAKRLLDYLRIDAEVKIININIKQKSIYEIIQAESYNSDLTIMGIPEIEKGKESKFVERINNLCKNVGTVIFIKSSSYFKEQNIGSRKKK
ncbi:MAG: hypothetical protein KAT68_14135, partial [Bacteroidales bacterium]|nr:hypothetical protein [Bacteroidales bacterium]